MQAKGRARAGGGICLLPPFAFSPGRLLPGHGRGRLAAPTAPPRLLPPDLAGAAAQVCARLHPAQSNPPASFRASYAQQTLPQLTRLVRIPSMHLSALAVRAESHSI